jgi:hypothetical protein
MWAELPQELQELLVRRFPAMVIVEMKDDGVCTDKALRALSSLTGRLTSLSLHWCKLVTKEGVRSLSSLTGLASLDLRCCIQVKALRRETAS